MAVCFIAVAALRAWQLRAAQEELQKTRALQLATLGARVLDGTIAQTHMLLASMGELLDPHAPPAQNDAVLQRIMRAGAVRYANLYLADTIGHALGTARAPAGGRNAFFIGDRKYFQTTLRRRRFNIGEVIATRTVPGNPLAIPFTLPVLDSATRRVVSVVGATIRVDSLEAVRSVRAMPEGTVLTIVDSSGSVVFRSLDPEHWIGRHVNVGAGAESNFTQREGVSAGADVDGVMRLVGFQAATLAPWIVYVGIPTRYTVDAVRNTFVRDVTVGLILSLILFAFSSRAALRVVRPIEALTRDARAVADGDLDRRAAVTSNDEVGDLAHAVNQMADTLVERGQALQVSQENLLHTQKMDALGSFAGGIAHDFNNYLHSIIGHTELAAESLPDGAPAQEDLNEVLATSKRAAELTRQILVFSRKQVVDRHRLDLRDVVRGITRMLHRLAGEDRRLEVVTGEVPVPVIADAGELEQVIVNLVANARDACGSGGRITLSTAVIAADGPSGSHIAELTVRDNGAGMTPDVRDRIFDPFFTTKGRAKGTGLGLSIVYGIVQQTGGTISVESAPEEGTAFIIRLPLASGAVEADAVLPAPAVGQRGSGRILITEDDGAVRETTRRMLQKAGYTVVTAVDGEAALKEIEAATTPFDLLLTDVVMPGISGPDLALRVTQMRPGIGVLFMSGHAEDVLAQESGAARSIALLQKPFSAAKLLAEVQRVLDGRPTGA